MDELPSELERLRIENQRLEAAYVKVLGELTELKQSMEPPHQELEIGKNHLMGAKVTNSAPCQTCDGKGYVEITGPNGFLSHFEACQACTLKGRCPNCGEPLDLLAKQCDACGFITKLGK